MGRKIVFFALIFYLLAYNSCATGPSGKMHDGDYTKDIDNSLVAIQTNINNINSNLSTIADHFKTVSEPEDQSIREIIETLNDIKSKLGYNSIFYSLIAPFLVGITVALIGIIPVIKSIRMQSNLNHLSLLVANTGGVARFTLFIQEVIKDGEADKARSAEDNKKTRINGIKSYYNDAWFLVLFANSNYLEIKFKKAIMNGDFKKAETILKKLMTAKYY